ncbi:hypothetical protein [Cryptosporangium aurantiacum]|uniref:Uncharacterized protein n=1 Tax=Cryptosporangium aurantiacum TaxID=134849 RepID=A0A1M7Q9B1_9ACTN|nr:hypothetical protein [Cryptosporangium aurantiacum]SHN26886.1 hypothetical protein SAMN05443668_104312 [Cryptosporangium aurantiacum]
MSVLETTLVFVIIPLAVAGVLALLTLGAGGGNRTPRYRPGMPFEFTPVWFLAAPPTSLSADGQHPALEGTSARGVLHAGSTPEAGSGHAVTVPNSGPKGGARGTW